MALNINQMAEFCFYFTCFIEFFYLLCTLLIFYFFILCNYCSSFVLNLLIFYCFYFYCKTLWLPQENCKVLLKFKIDLFIHYLFIKW